MLIKNSLDENIILGGGGHNMAAGFTLKKENLKTFEVFISKHFLAFIFTKSQISINSKDF